MFLDIYMPGLNGNQVAQKIRETDKDVGIVFTTSSKEYAIDSYNVEAMHYLVKPIKYEQLSAALDRCYHRFSKGLRFIEVVSNRIGVKILLKDIYYAEIFDKVCLIHTKQGDTKTYTTLDEIETMLGGLPFLRCHRTHIVNMNHIADILDEEFLLKNGAKVPIRKTEKVAIKQAYLDYMFQLARRER